MPPFKVLTPYILWLLTLIGVFAQQTENPELTSLREKAKQGDPASQLSLANCYGLGKFGAERSISQSIHWLGLAARGPDINIRRKAGFQLAFLFSFGGDEIGGAKEALFWSEQTYRLGETNALSLCAFNHRRLGNLKMAYAYALADARWTMSKEKIGKVEAEYEKLLSPRERELARKDADALDPLKMMNKEADEVLLKVLTMLATKGEHDSEHELGLQHLSGGMGLTKDKEKAIYWLKRAAAGGHQKAKDKLVEISGQK